MTTVRTMHTTDVTLSHGKRRRVIKNYANYRTHAGLWIETVPGLGVVGDMPDGASPIFNGLEFAWQSVEQPLWTFSGDTRENRVFWGMQHSDRPETGIVIWAINANSVGALGDTDAHSVTWDELYPATNLTITHTAGQARKMFRLGAVQAPERIRLGYQLPDGWSLSIHGNVVDVLNGDGEIEYTSPPAYATDADGASVPTVVTYDGTQVIGGVGTVHVVELSFDHRGFVHPVDADPTTTIPQGDSGIEDTTNISGTNADYNYGSLTGIYHRYSDTRRTLIRFASDDIPSGTITAVRCSLYASLYGSSPTFHRIPDGDSDWIEGTGGGSPAQVGSPCWNWKAYATDAWSAAGCGYVVDGTERTTDMPEGTGDAERVTFAWDPSWVTGWRDATFGNGGALLRDATAGTGFAYSSESTSPPSSKPYLEIDYDATKPYYYNMINAMRRR